MKFRKKPIVIEAVQFTYEMARGDIALPDGVLMMMRDTDAPPERKLRRHRHIIETLEGDHDVQIGDWIITGVQGEHYPCKPDIFEMTYEPAEEGKP